jgi:hypothetical protein
MQSGAAIRKQIPLSTWNGALKYQGQSKQRAAHNRNRQVASGRCSEGIAECNCGDKKRYRSADVSRVASFKKKESYHDSDCDNEKKYREWH